jgi:biotin carboxyl carrier protein
MCPWAGHRAHFRQRRRMTARPRPTPRPRRPPADAATTLPEGHSVTMPQLGMAQDTGMLVNWLKAPGDEVAADDILFEVETDKSTMEVEAGRAGYLAATLAEAGEDVPVGDPVAIISRPNPKTPVARSIRDGAAAPAVEPGRRKSAVEKPKAPPARRPRRPRRPGSAGWAHPGLAQGAAAGTLEQGLDLNRWSRRAIRSPSTLRISTCCSLPAGTRPPRRAKRRAVLTATLCRGWAADFVSWAAEAGGQTRRRRPAGRSCRGEPAGREARLRGGGTFRREHVVFAVPTERTLSRVCRDRRPARRWCVRDLRGTRLSSVRWARRASPS